MNHCPPPEHPVKRQVGVRPCGHVRGLDQQGLWSSIAQQEQRARASAPVQLPEGSREPLLRLLPASALSELHSQQPKVRQLLISPGPQPRQPGPPRGGDALRPPLAVCSLSCLGAGTCHEMPAVTNRHHIMLPLWSGCPGDCRIWGGCFEPLLAPAPTSGNWNSSSSWLWQVLGTFLIILHLWGPAVCCSSDGRSHDKCPERDQSWKTADEQRHMIHVCS